ncbi:FG-GAP-like repeat-containing protein [Ascidiimonas sp. W6]|uniref:FG-GAP-like repeat-containing protein n=1 Tax=Ascidiimonas meishanensis TaxID=3128903 RepID=UPI0030EF2DBE
MKKIGFLLMFLFVYTSVFAQDTFTYKKIKSTDIQKQDLPMSEAPANVQAKVTEESLSAASGGSGVGETSGSLSVSLSGGANYSVPIAVPVGPAGIKPSIALSYSSQAGNGMAGFGWNVSGVSVISRIPSSKYHDGDIDPVDFDSSDRFAFDGQRMILKSGTHGASGAVYETEQYSNIKITAYGTSYFGAAYGPGYFQVKYPDGSYSYYGLGGDSRSRTDYAITYWRSPQGVLIHYNYTTSGNGLSISKIRWGARSSSSHMNEIQFVYGTRKRYEHSYVGGMSFVRTNLLKEIKVLSSGVGYRNYILNHNYTTLGYDRLTSVQEKSGDNSLSHTPITFNYNNTSSSISSVNTTYSLSVGNIEQRNAEAISLDITGNGKMDFVVHPKSSSLRNKFWVFKEIQSGYPNFAYEVNTGGRFESLFPVTWLTHNNKILSGQGIAIAQNYGSTQVKFKVYSNGTTNPIYYQYEKLWNAPTYTSSYSCGSSNTYRINQQYISGDFNGDGLSDVIAISKPYSYSSCYQTLPDPNNPCGGFDDPFLSNYEKTGLDENESKELKESSPDLVGPPRDESRIPIGGGGTCCECNSYSSSSARVSFINLDRRLTSGFANSAGFLSSSFGSSDKLYTGDVNGDGKTDILHVKAGRIYAYTLKSNNYIQLLWSTSDSRITTTRPIMLGDYNGDGKTDFMTPVANNSYTFTTFLSTGNSFSKRESSMSFQYKETNWNGSNGTLYGYNLIPVDINGDGRTDIVDYQTRTYNSSSNGTQYVRIYNNGYSTSTNGTPTFSYSGYASKYGNLKHFPIPVFVSQDRPNSNLDFGSISNSWVSSFRFSKDHREEMLLRSVVSNGVTQSIRYNSLNTSDQGLDYMPVYQYTYNNTYPYIDIEIAPGTKVVTALQRIRSGTTTLKQIYSYKGAVTNVERGFQGFTGIAKSNWHTGNSDRLFTMRLHNTTTLRGAVTSEYQAPYSINFNSIPSNYTHKNTYSYTSSLSASKVFKLTNTSIVTQDRLEGTTITNSFIYDSYNNPTKTTTNYSGQGSKVVDMTYANSTGSSYYIGRPTKKVETTVIGGNSYNSEEQYVYSGWNMSQRKFRGDGTQFNTEAFTYDIYGNVTKKIITPYGSNSREIRFEYDATGRFRTKQIDEEGQTTTWYYNTSKGLQTREVNRFGQNTYFYYDGWNRLIRARDYLNKNVNTSYSESNYTYTVTTTSDDGASKISVYDPLKRLTLSKEKNAMGQWVQTSHQYDKFDRMYRESEPFTSSPSQYTTKEFDLYGRLTKITSPSGKVVTYSYSGLVTTVNDGTKTVTTTKDAMGNVTRVVDPGGTINYTYFGNGNMKTASYGSVTLSQQQDGWGHKTQLSDPSAGTYNYEYNGFGEVTKEIGPKGTTTYTYSPTGKITQRKIIGDATNMTTNYTYNSSTKLLTSMSLTSGDGNNSSYSYAYDSYKRISSVTENTPYARFIKRYTYDSYGREYTVENEARLLSNNKVSKHKVKKTYTYGGLRTLKDYTSNENLWSLSGINARGQITSYSSGVGLVQTNSYNSYGFHTSMVTKKVTLVPIGSPNPGTVELTRLNYNFNSQRGILNSRTNSLFNWTENFQYDSMDRLTSFSDNTGSKTHTYDAQGRIKKNNKIGDYVYSGSSYQLASLTLNSSGQSHYNNYTRQQVSYNAFKSPVEIHEHGKDRVSFEYNAFENRSNMFYGGTQSNKLQRRYRKHYSYDGSMEISHDTQSGKTTFVSYANGDAYAATAIWRSEQTGTTSQSYLYLQRDYLGSIIGITDKNGAFKEKRHFDAWGNLVKLTNGSGTNLSAFGILDRGYTGHEHLQGVKLVHMNGRLYDPVLHRFIQPDNFVQNPYNTQNFNRYGYVLNNPLMYTDPSGEFFWVAVIIGAVIGGISAALKPGATFGSILGGILIGAVAGAIGAGVGNVVAGGTFFGSQVATTVGFWAGAASGFAGGFAGGFVGAAGNAWLSGASFGDGLKAGLVGGLVGGIVGGLVNGVVSEIRYQKHIAPFRKSLDEMGINASDPVPATDEFLQKAQEAWFPDAPMENVKNFSVENLSDNAKNYFAAGKADGLTSPLYQRVDGQLIASGNSNVYFNPDTAFTSAEQLFKVMGHELIHVSQIAHLAGQTSTYINSLRDMMEFHAYNYQSVIGAGTTGNSFTAAEIRGWMTNNPDMFKALGHLNFSWSLNFKFKYPLD